MANETEIKYLTPIAVETQRKEQSLRNTLPSVGCFLLLMGNMLEATLVGFNYLSGVVFAIVCGALAQMNKTKEQA